MYYYNKKGENYGPFTFDQLSKERIEGDTMIWYQGMPEWQPAKNVKELESIIWVPVPKFNPSVPPPLPTQPPPVQYQAQPQTIIYNTALPAKKKMSFGAKFLIFLLIIGGVAVAYVAFSDYVIRQRIEAREEYERNLQAQ
jgi:hypothetical protein